MLVSSYSILALFHLSHKKVVQFLQDADYHCMISLCWTGSSGRKIGNRKDKIPPLLKIQCNLRRWEAAFPWKGWRSLSTRQKERLEQENPRLKSLLRPMIEKAGNGDIDSINLLLLFLPWKVSVYSIQGLNVPIWSYSCWDMRLTLIKSHREKFIDKRMLREFLVNAVSSS